MKKKAYMNYVNPSIINYQPISYAETTATVVSEEAPKASTNETLGANTPTEGEYMKNETKFYKLDATGKASGSRGKGKVGGGKAKKIAVPDYKDYASEYRKSSRSASSLLKSMKTYSRDELKNRLKEYASPQKTKDVSGRLNYYLTGEDKPKTFEDQFKKYFGK